MQTEALNLVKALEALAQITREAAAKVEEASRSKPEEPLKPPSVLLTPKEMIATAVERLDHLSDIRRQKAEEQSHREIAYMDVFEALMKLFAYEEARPVAEQVMALVRETKETAADDSPDYKYPSAPDASASKEEKLAYARGVIAEGKESTEKMFAASRERLQKLIALFNRALELARPLA